MYNLNISFYLEVYHDLGYQMVFVSQLLSFRLIFLTQNPLVSDWTNGQDPAPSRIVDNIGCNETGL